MKHILLILALVLLPSCVAHHELRMAGSDFSKNSTDNVRILDEPPAWNYYEVGYVQAQASPFVSDVQLYRKLQLAAAKIGADAVIPQISFDDYKGRDEDEFVSRVIKGTAICRVRK